MRRILRWGTRLLFLSIVVGGVALVWRWDDLIRLYDFNTLYDENRIVGNFSHMDSMFLTTPVARGGEVSAFRSRPVALPERFAFRGRDISMEEFLTRRATTSLLVARDDEITFEQYYLGTGADDRRMSFSMAKSFISALVGVALEEGAIKSLDDKVETYEPAFIGTAYEGATIRNVLNMASGIAFNEDYLDDDSDINKMGRTLAFGRSMDKFTLGQNRKAGPPGEAFRYVSIDTHVIAMVLRAATGTPLPEYLSAKIWSRIGAEADALYLTDGLGVAFALGGLNIRTRDYARFGRLMLNGGALEGVQIVPAEWIAQSTVPSAPPAPGGAESDFGYGLHWWIPSGGEGDYLARGIYGQFIYVNPVRRVVIVKTSADLQFRANDGESNSEAVAAFRAIAESLAPAEAPSPADDDAPADDAAPVE